MIVQVSALLAAAPMQAATSVQDTAGKVAYVPKAGGPPDSSSYMWAGYAVALAAYGGYIVILLRRMARAKRAR